MRRYRTLPIAVICLAVFASATTVTHAQQAMSQVVGPTGIITQQQNGVQARMPLNARVSRRNGLSLAIDTRWANNYGYRPIEVTVNSLKPTTTDHSITIRIHTGWWSSQRGSMTVEQDFEMLQGSTTATALVSCPQYQLTTQYYWWEVWIDGVKDRDLSRDQRNPVTAVGTGMAPGGGQGLSVLTVGPISRQRWLTSPNSQEFETLSLPATSFPSRWIDYTCFDVLSLSRAELQNVARSNPDALTAIRRWVESGGQVWISDGGASWEHLAEVAKVFGVPATLMGIDEATAGNVDETTTDDSGEDTADETASAVAWRPVRFGRDGPLGRVVTFLDLTTGQSRVARDQATIDQLQKDPNFAVTNQAFQAEPDGTRRRWPRDSSRWFVDQTLGLGTLRAFRGEQTSILFPPGQQNTGADPNVVGADPNVVGAEPIVVEGQTGRPQSPLQMALRATRRWDSRHGLKPDDANHDFAKLLVPNVGLAPVTEFQILITLFVLLIGPVNYWLLKRYNRLQLLVLTVPLAAIVLTSSLFAYAVLSDGFGTTIRAQSVTKLDQRTGDATCWSRLSYYAGLAPGQGLTMPDDVAVYPIIPGWNDSGVDASIGAARELMWEGNEARMTRGWLRSRTPTQYLTVRARKSPHRIELTPAAGRIRAVNQLGAAIKFVLVFDKDGALFAGENLGPESKSVLEPIGRVDAIRRMRQLMTENQPEAPPALAAEDSDFQVMQRRQSRRMMRNQFGLQYSEQRLEGNLLSDALADLSGLAGQPALSLPPRSYVAVTETGPEVVLGVPSAEEQASFHVLIGRW